MENVLSITVFTPLLAGLILAAFLRGDDPTAQRNAKWVTLIATTLTFLVSLFIFVEFDAGDPGFQYIEETPWVLGLQYKLGVDGISVLFVMLTTTLVPFIVASSWDQTHRVKEYMMSFLFLETLLLGVFMSLDVVLFILFFEATIIPLFLLIGIWGGAERLNASFKMVIFNGIGAVLMLTVMLLLYQQAGSTDIETLTNYTLESQAVTVFGIEVSGGIQSLLLLLMLLALAIRFAFWPLHRWMLDAQAEAPPAGSIVLGALLINTAGYVLLRFALPIFPVAIDAWAPILLWLSVVTLVFATLAALSQNDMKRCVGYMIMAQMAVVAIGIFSITEYSIQGAIFYMVSQGFVVAGLLLCFGLLEQRAGTRQADALGGMVENMPRFAACFMIFTLAVMAVPGSGGFVGLLLTLMGVVGASGYIALIVLLCWLISAAVMLGLYRQVMFGALIKGSLKSVKDASRREKAIMLPLVAIILTLGIFPGPALDMIGPTVEALVANYETSLAQLPDASPAATQLVELAE